MAGDGAGGEGMLGEALGGACTRARALAAARESASDLECLPERSPCKELTTVKPVK
jgi:hypothetical protein